MSVGVKLPWYHASLDPSRALNALRLVVAKLDGGLYKVCQGTGTTIYNVYLGRDLRNPLCDCQDHTYREVVCKHAIAAMLSENDRRAIEAVGKGARDAWLDGRLIVAIKPKKET